MCSAGESGKAPVPFPRTPKNLGFVSAKELPLVHLPTPHALTTSHRSRKAAGSKGLEGSSWEMWSTNKLQEESRKDKGEFELLMLPLREDLVTGLLNGHTYPWPSQQQNEDPG